MGVKVGPKSNRRMLGDTSWKSLQPCKTLNVYQQNTSHARKVTLMERESQYTIYTPLCLSLDKKKQLFFEEHRHVRQNEILVSQSLENRSARIQYSSIDIPVFKICHAQNKKEMRYCMRLFFFDTFVCLVHAEKNMNKIKTRSSASVSMAASVCEVGKWV